MLAAERVTGDKDSWQGPVGLALMISLGSLFGGTSSSSRCSTQASKDWALGLCGACVVNGLLAPLAT